MALFQPLELSCPFSTVMFRRGSDVVTSINLNVADDQAWTLKEDVHLFKDGMAQLKEKIAKTPKLSYAFVDAPLPNGAVVIVRLNQPGSMSDYAVFTQSAFESGTFLDAHVAQAWYRNRRVDNSPTTITVFADRSLEVVSRDFGTINDNLLPRIGGPDTSGVGGRVLKRLSKKAQAVDVPDFGSVRVISP